MRWCEMDTQEFIKTVEGLLDIELMQHVESTLKGDFDKFYRSNFSTNKVQKDGFITLGALFYNNFSLYLKNQKSNLVLLTEFPPFVKWYNQNYDSKLNPLNGFSKGGIEMLWETYLKKTRNGHYYISVGREGEDTENFKAPYRIGYVKLGDTGKTTAKLPKYNDDAECYDINYENSGAFFLNVNHSYPWSYKSAHHFFIIDSKKPYNFLNWIQNSPIKSS
tara:strand:- start:1079 stop:1738 length:660 start_codon:yes stop_codon:yes gene_type:complete